MVTSEAEITRRLDDKDAARRARRATAATTIGELARRHSELARELTTLERELGATLTAAGDVLDLPELAQVTDIPLADLTRWRDQAPKPRGRKRKHTTTHPRQPTGQTSPATTPPPTQAASTDAPAAAAGAARRE